MIAIILEGGLVQAIVSDDPKDLGKEIMVIDYDTEGAEVTELVNVPFAGDSTEATARIDTINSAEIDLTEVERQCRE